MNRQAISDAVHIYDLDDQLRRLEALLHFLAVANGNPDFHAEKGRALIGLASDLASAAMQAKDVFVGNVNLGLR